MRLSFDSCYTNTTRETVAGGARLIAMPNYDPPTPRGVLHRLHGAMLPFRAVENRVPFVRADSNGLSQIVNPSGQIVGQSPLFAPDILVGTVKLGDGQGTFFTRWGDWLAYLCLLIVVVRLGCPHRHLAQTGHYDRICISCNMRYTICKKVVFMQIGTALL